MKAASLLYVLSAPLLFVNADTNSTDHQQWEESLDAFIMIQQDISLQGMLNNIVDGMVVAGRSDPDYWFTWTRTAALTFKILIERSNSEYWDMRDTPEISDHIADYVLSQEELQTVRNPSGGIRSGGLGEPKFNVNGTAFNSAWNRPQQDGPALRAITLIIYAEKLLANAGYLDQDSDVWEIWPSIQEDLEHTVRYWNHTSFDMWEETKGSSFFTLSASHRALVQGIDLAERLGERCDGCAATAPQILCLMDRFWDLKHMHANLNAKGQRSGIDAGTILSSVYTALANHKTVTDSFRPLYGINTGIAQGQGVAVGRYPEDNNHGGNPWYVTTLGAAEQLYRAGLQWQDQGQLTIDETSLPFFRDLLPTISVGTYRSGSDPAIFQSVLSAVRNYADSYMALVQKYTPTDGGLPEQFDRNNGVAVSASNFTWSHAAFYTAANARASVRGYFWPELINHSFSSSQCYCHVRVTFRVRSDPGKVLYVVGDVRELGDGKKEDARMLRQERGGSEFQYQYANYSAQIELPASTRINYHYFMLGVGRPKEEAKYEYRHIETGDCGSDVEILGDVFIPRY
ncbi:uncharacterized protein J4E78_003760 [Alternaria triticimaculans]|uniref:uncharacterized protein n=1 Tax=Alternaria triticimaculans TaxID=297637 RepID=UPI0020C35A11|nr:uncharacterized protein J4E78_003760 [Alternaria triticimaculans]KAI4663348.1 hypothetical protein J4E78_003760 [Alternaria triticimaculans]